MTPLHVLGDTLRDALAAVPLGVVRGCFVLLPVVLVIWTWSLSPRQTCPRGSTPRWYQDLRIWATVALGAQIAIYAFW